METQNIQPENKEKIVLEEGTDEIIMDRQNKKSDFYEIFKQLL